MTSSGNVSRNQLTEIQKKALDAVVDYHVSHEANGTPIGHVVLAGTPKETPQYKTAALWLARSHLVEAVGIAPNYTLHPTWLGLMLSSKAGIVDLLTGKLLVFFKSRINSQGVDFKKYTLEEMIGNRVIGKADALFLLHAVIRAFDLASDSNTSAGPPPSATWWTPRDIIDFRAFNGMRELQIRVQLGRHADPPVVLNKQPNEPAETGMPKNSKDVFVVHGRNEAVRRAIFDFLRAVGLNPMEFEEARRRTNKTSPYIGEILSVAFAEAQAIVVVFSGDDEAKLRSDFHGTSEPRHETDLTPQSRQNVLFEAGMAIGRDENHTILVEVGNNLRPLSDIAGRHTVRLVSGSVDERTRLVERLKTAECDINTDGKTDWLTGPYFEKVFRP